MTDARLAAIPPEARAYQGGPAGVATRLVANTIDGIVVGLVLAGGYAGYAALRLMTAPRDFRMPDPSLLWTMTIYLLVAEVYLTAAWWLSGRTYGDHVMGIRVIDARGTRVGLLRALLRAVFCVAFPIGLLWCAVGPRRRSVQDLVLRTSVIYDWLRRPPARGMASSAEGGT